LYWKWNNHNEQTIENGVIAMGFRETTKFTLFQQETSKVLVDESSQWAILFHPKIILPAIFS